MTLAGWGGRLAIVHQVAPCGSSSDFLLIHVNLVCEPCMYVCMHSPHHLLHLFTLPLSSTLSSPLHPYFTLTPHSSHPHTPHSLLTLTPHTSPSYSSHSHSPSITLTPHTRHSPSHSLLTLLTDTENVFPLMVWVLDDRQKK